MGSLDELETEWKANGLEFSGFGQAEPKEPWEYIIDDYAISYGPGVWPFYRQRGGKRFQSHVRLAPNTEFKSWNTMYAGCGFYDGVIHFDFNVHCCKQGMGTLSYPCDVRFDENVKLLTLRAAEKAKGDALRYVVKFQTFMTFHLAQRNAGKRKIITAHAEYDKKMGRTKEVL